VSDVNTCYYCCTVNFWTRLSSIDDRSQARVSLVLVTLVWPWPWPRDLHAPPRPRYSEDACTRTPTRS